MYYDAASSYLDLINVVNKEAGAEKEPLIQEPLLHRNCDCKGARQLIAG